MKRIRTDSQKGDYMATWKFIEENLFGWEIGKYRQSMDEKKAEADDCIGFLLYLVPLWFSRTGLPQLIGYAVLLVAHAFLKLNRKELQGTEFLIFMGGEWYCRDKPCGNHKLGKQFIDHRFRDRIVESANDWIILLVSDSQQVPFPVDCVAMSAPTHSVT
jgi:hypothetical protein